MSTRCDAYRALNWLASEMAEDRLLAAVSRKPTRAVLDPSDRPNPTPVKDPSRAAETTLALKAAETVLGNVKSASCE
ncbi:MAG: hypothetical protein BWY99_01784 [Synergistetes bacterium ADurb.BinA166]|nr:MAG: hypothetical protein BWY99_01784 [Synergistetes bacterium ADurb.BinA166]